MPAPQQSNLSGVLLASAARTATITTPQLNSFKPGSTLTVIINVTAVSGSPSLVPKIQGVSASGAVYDILAGAAITGVGTTVLAVGPTLVAAANLKANAAVPLLAQVVVTAGTADSVTYTVDYQLV